MATSQGDAIIQHLRRAVLSQEATSLTDGQLLACFVEHRDEAAFEALVRRHGPMVLGVCRRFLRNVGDSDDAFQATFLVLVRKAASIRPREMVGNWLYGVAYNTALKARAMAAKRIAREKPMNELPEPTATQRESDNEFLPLLDQELNRLPDRYRVPIVLCDLEGKTHQEAARQLGWPQGTLSGRLSRGRHLLAGRLKRRGLPVAVGALGMMLSDKLASASVPLPLLNSTVQAGTLMTSGQAVTTAVLSSQVTVLMEGVLRSMLLCKLKMVVVGAIILVLVGLGTGVMSERAIAAKPAAVPAVVAVNQERGGDTAVSITAKVVSGSKDGKTVRIEVPPKARGDEPTQIDLKLTDKTSIVYDGVPPGGAKPTEGYQAQVTFQPGSSDTAARVRFVAANPSAGAGLSAPVVEVSADGKTITVEVPQGRGPDAEKKKVPFTMTEQTKVSYVHLGKGSDKPKVGYLATVWYAETRENVTVERVVFTDMRRQATYIGGGVVGVAKNGGAFTILQPSEVRGGEPRKVEVKFTVETEVTYHGVGPDEANLVEGLSARVWWYDEKAAMAAKIMLMKGGERGR